MTKPTTFPIAGTLLVLGLLACGAASCDADHTLGGVNGPDGSLPDPGGAAGSPAGPTDGGIILPSGVGGGMAASVDASAAITEAGPLGPTESWTGYVEGYRFPSGSDRIRLTFASDANGIVVGRIVFGEGTPPPPATNPDVGYPPSVFYPGYEIQTSFGSWLFAEGFEYEAMGKLDAHRLRLRYSLMELWSEWCTLQTPPADHYGNCLPNRAGGKAPSGGCYLENPTTHKAETVDCGKWNLCTLLKVCSCTATSCAPPPLSDNGDYTFDVFLQGDTASGSIAIVGGRNVHFLKD